MLNLYDDKVRADLQQTVDAIRAVLDDYRAIIESATFPPVHRAALPPVEDYAVVRADMVNRIFDAFIGYLSSGGSVARFRNAGRRALVDDIPAAFYSAFADAAGAEAETDPEDEAWITAQVTAQMGFMDNAFESLKEWRAAENFTEADVQARAELWGGMLDGVYSQGFLRGGKNATLEFGGDSGEESCATCQKLMGKRHSTKWVIEHDMIPYPGNKAFECGGWQCAHGWKNVKTGEWVTL